MKLYKRYADHIELRERDSADHWQYKNMKASTYYEFSLKGLPVLESNDRKKIAKKLRAFAGRIVKLAVYLEQYPK